MTAHFFDEFAEEHEAVVRVLEAAAGLVGEPARSVELDVVVVLPEGEPVLVELGTEDVAGASSMGE
jgi:hypothetical protein